MSILHASIIPPTQIIHPRLKPWISAAEAAALELKRIGAVEMVGLLAEFADGYPIRER